MISPQFSKWISRIRRNTGLFVVLALCFATRGNAQEQKPFFLPKSATAAAYVLNRLSNEELIAAPRSEFVYVALLQRKGLERKYRLEALAGLAQLRQTDILTELLTTLESLDKKGDQSTTLLLELAPLLLQAKPEELRIKATQLEKLAFHGEMPTTRQIAFAALSQSTDSIQKIWRETQANDASRLDDLISSIPLVPDAARRTAFYPILKRLLHQTNSPLLRKAAIQTIVTIPGHDSETGGILASFLKSNIEMESTISGLAKISGNLWQPREAEGLVQPLLNYLQSIPLDRRMDDSAVDAFRLADVLTSRIPSEKADGIRQQLRSLGISVFVIRAVPEKMQYDKTLLVVEVGKPVQIILQNDDAMPHNLLVVMPGASEEIGQMAEKMQPIPDALGRVYVPDSSKVLHATKLVESGQHEKISFAAPSEPGDYQFVCSFPGHWRLMVGTLAVINEGEAHLREDISVPRQMTEWKPEDFIEDLSRPAKRDVAQGRELFTQLACASCHQFAGHGTDFGPDMTGIFKAYENNSLHVLRHILDPSAVVSDRYRSVRLETTEGESLVGIVTAEDDKTVTVQTGPGNASLLTMGKSEIKDRIPQNVSMMPAGLLNSLSKEQVLDLLAYLKNDEPTSSHHHKH